MTNPMSRREYLRKKRKRRFRKKLYDILFFLSELEFHLNPKSTICLLCAGLLLISLFLPVHYKPATNLPESAAATQLCHTIHTLLEENELPAADITLLLLPDTKQVSSDTLAENTEPVKIVSPLYGVYLTGKEVYWLTELYTSLGQSFEDNFVYFDGLQLTYHPYRPMLNRTLTATLLRPDGTVKELQKDMLYHVVGTDSLFYLFDYLNSRSEHLLKIRSKTENGTLFHEPVALTDKNGSILMLSTNFSTETLNREGQEKPTTITKTTSLNASVLLCRPNRAGLFILLNNILLLLLLLFMIPRIKRICIWIRIYLIRRRKRGGKPIYHKENQKKG